MIQEKFALYSFEFFNAGFGRDDLLSLTEGEAE
jgi:hypothetical protein